MPQNKILLYGAYGYTGELIARYARDYGLQPILAGRNEAKLAPLGKSLDLPFRVIDLDNQNDLLNALTDIELVIHAAGPFQFTARQMVEACLQAGTHYIDINGDISVFEALKNYDAQAKEKNIMILPGAGFDVVPTDCMALLLKNSLPDAIALKLAFATLGGGLSHGTATSVVHRLGEGGAVRRNGKIVSVPLGANGMMVDFGVKKLFVMSIPWGDIATAHFTTGIPDIETYTGISKGVFRILKFQGMFNWLLRTGFIRRLIKKKVDSRPAGPDDEQRHKATSLVWGQATNAAGKTATTVSWGPEGYTLTAHSCLIIAKKILAGNHKPGFQTPASAYGEDLVLEVPGVQRKNVSLS